MCKSLNSRPVPFLPLEVNLVIRQNTRLIFHDHSSVSSAKFVTIKTTCLLTSRPNFMMNGKAKLLVPDRYKSINQHLLFPLLWKKKRKETVRCTLSHRVCVRARVRACVRACVRVCVCVSEQLFPLIGLVLLWLVVVLVFEYYMPGKFFKNFNKCLITPNTAPPPHAPRPHPPFSDPGNIVSWDNCLWKIQLPDKIKKWRLRVECCSQVTV